MCVATCHAFCLFFLFPVLFSLLFPPCYAPKHIRVVCYAQKKTCVSMNFFQIYWGFKKKKTRRNPQKKKKKQKCPKNFGTRQTCVTNFLMDLSTMLCVSRIRKNTMNFLMKYKCFTHLTLFCSLFPSKTCGFVVLHLCQNTQVFRAQVFLCCVSSEPPTIYLFFVFVFVNYVLGTLYSLFEKLVFQKASFPQNVFSAHTLCRVEPFFVVLFALENSFKNNKKEKKSSAVPPLSKWLFFCVHAHLQSQGTTLVIICAVCIERSASNCICFRVELFENLRRSCF